MSDCITKTDEQLVKAIIQFFDTKQFKEGMKLKEIRSNIEKILNCNLDKADKDTKSRFEFFIKDAYSFYGEDDWDSYKNEIDTQRVKLVNFYINLVETNSMDNTEKNIKKLKSAAKKEYGSSPLSGLAEYVLKMYDDGENEKDWNKFKQQYMEGVSAPKEETKCSKDLEVEIAKFYIQEVQTNKLEATSENRDSITNKAQSKFNCKPPKGLAAKVLNRYNDSEKVWKDFKKEYGIVEKEEKCSKELESSIAKFYIQEVQTNKLEAIKENADSLTLKAFSKFGCKPPKSLVNKVLNRYNEGREVWKQFKKEYGVEEKEVSVCEDDKLTDIVLFCIEKIETTKMESTTEDLDNLKDMVQEKFNCDPASKAIAKVIKSALIKFNKDPSDWEEFKSKYIKKAPKPTPKPVAEKVVTCGKKSSYGSYEDIDNDFNCPPGTSCDVNKNQCSSSQSSKSDSFTFNLSNGQPITIYGSGENIRSLQSRINKVIKPSVTKKTESVNIEKGKTCGTLEHGTPEELWKDLSCPNNDICNINTNKCVPVSSISPNLVKFVYEGKELVGTVLNVAEFKKKMNIEEVEVPVIPSVSPKPVKQQKPTSPIKYSPENIVHSSKEESKVLQELATQPVSEEDIDKLFEEEPEKEVKVIDDQIQKLQSERMVIRGTPQYKEAFQLIRTIERSELGLDKN